MNICRIKIEGIQQIHIGMGKDMRETEGERYMYTYIYIYIWSGVWRSQPPRQCYGLKGWGGTAVWPVGWDAATGSHESQGGPRSCTSPTTATNARTWARFLFSLYDDIIKIKAPISEKDDK